CRRDLVAGVIAVREAAARLLDVSAVGASLRLEADALRAAGLVTKLRVGRSAGAALGRSAGSRRRHVAAQRREVAAIGCSGRAAARTAARCLPSAGWPAAAAGCSGRSRTAALACAAA